MKIWQSNLLVGASLLGMGIVVFLIVLWAAVR